MRSIVDDVLLASARQLCIRSGHTYMLACLTFGMGEPLSSSNRSYSRSQYCLLCGVESCDSISAFMAGDFPCILTSEYTGKIPIAGK